MAQNHYFYCSRVHASQSMALRRSKLSLVQSSINTQCGARTRTFYSEVLSLDAGVVVNSQLKMHSQKPHAMHMLLLLQGHGVLPGMLARVWGVCASKGCGRGT